VVHVTPAAHRRASRVRCGVARRGGIGALRRAMIHSGGEIYIALEPIDTRCYAEHTVMRSCVAREAEGLEKSSCHDKSIISSLGHKEVRACDRTSESSARSAPNQERFPDEHEH
jgi:hypothetical protein